MPKKKRGVVGSIMYLIRKSFLYAFMFAAVIILMLYGLASAIVDLFQ